MNLENAIKQKIVSIKEALHMNLPETMQKYGLMSGSISKVLFYNNYLKLFDDPTAENDAEQIIKHNFASIEQNFNGLSLSNGLAGLTFAINYLLKEDIIDEPLVDAAITNHELLNYSNFEINKGNYDYLHGGIGPILNLIERDGNDQLLDSFILCLYKKKIDINEHEITFYSFSQKLKKNTNYSDFGLAHGLPSILVFLSKARNRTIHKQICDELLYKIIRYLNKFKNNNKESSFFPYGVTNEIPPLNKNSRLAWCYGDLGIASSFWQAGKTLNDENLKQEAIEIMLHACKRRGIEENQLKDAGLCHGTSGISHIFNRFYKETGIKQFEEAQWYWLDQTLKMATFADGLAGFKTWHSEGYGFLNENGLLQGISGIGLAFLGSLSEDINELNWDTSLLLS